MRITPPSKTRTLLQVRAAAVALVLSAVPVYLGIRFSFYAYFAAAFLVLLCLFAVFFYIPRFVKSISVTVTEEGVAVKYGVFFKTEQIMPALRTVYTELRQTPLAKRMGLCSVSFSGAKAKVTVPEIAVEDAEKITKMCKKTGKGEPGE